MARISLSKLNEEGAIAYIEDDDGNETMIAVDFDNSDAEQICQEAAKELRELADAFDRFAEMEKPFTHKDQGKAMLKPTARITK